MSPRLPAAAFALAALFLPLAAAATPVKTEHVEAELLAQSTSAQPGKPLLVGLQLRMTPQWHTYWKNPGDSGLPTRIQWQLPPGWKAGPIQWPYPKRLPVGPLMNYGYEDEVVLVSEITPSADAPPGPANLHAKAEWLVCKDICIPEKGELDLALPVAHETPKPDPRGQAQIEHALRQLPVAARGWKSETALAGKSLVVRMTAPEGMEPPANAIFFPERELLIEPAAPQKLAREGRSLTFVMKLADPPPATLEAVKGVVVSERGWPGIEAGKALEVEAQPVASLPVAAATLAPVDAIGGGIGGSAVAALVFAFVGGLLLNLMPCVFPVLGIKVMGFVEHAHGEARAMRRQGAFYSAGVLLSFAALAGLMLALRAGGMQLGWGFQLQSPAVVAVLACLFFVLALNLSGLFEWGAFAQSMTAHLTARGRYADAFLSGVLATVVATPCTAPFMGAAVGFTMTQSAGLALAVFVTIGAGMALPVLLLALYPALLRRLPRPGAWMETFKQVLAFPLYATAAWLAWVLGAQAGNDAVLALLLGLVLLALAGWFYGRWAHVGSLWQPAIALGLGLLAVFVAWPPAATSTAARAAEAAEAGWEAWSPEKVRQYTAEGRVVFVDFTAAWCVTCQVNKRVALHNDAVVKAFAAHRVALLKADWTRQDPRITAALAALGRNAVPVYALYLPGEEAPRLLPELLTPAIMLAEIDRLPASGATALTQR